MLCGTRLSALGCNAMLPLWHACTAIHFSIRMIVLPSPSTADEISDERSRILSNSHAAVLLFAKSPVVMHKHSAQAALASYHLLEKTQPKELAKLRGTGLPALSAAAGGGPTPEVSVTQPASPLRRAVHVVLAELAACLRPHIFDAMTQR